MTALPTPAVSATSTLVAGAVPTLESGDHLGAAEFLRRYEAMPEVNKAELINGVVFMASPVRTDQHAEPDSLIQTWLGTYAIATPGVRAAVNGTVRLGPDDVAQPDAFLRVLPEWGGQARLDARGYLVGAPELVVEVAASSASLDVREKMASYRRAGVQEYLVWRTRDSAVDWWILQDDEYHPLPADAGGILRSRAFPGLWLELNALLAGHGDRVLAKLQEGIASGEHGALVASLRDRRSAFAKASTFAPGATVDKSADKSQIADRRSGQSGEEKG